MCLGNMLSEAGVKHTQTLLHQDLTIAALESSSHTHRFTGEEGSWPQCSKQGRLESKIQASRYQNGGEAQAESAASGSHGP